MTDLEKIQKIISKYNDFRINAYPYTPYIELIQLLSSDSNEVVFNKKWFSIRKNKFSLEKMVSTIERMHPEYNLKTNWSYNEDLVLIMKMIKRDIKIKNILKDD